MNARALVARNLRRLRVQMALSQEKLAVDAGIDRAYVSRMERGLEDRTVAIFERLAAALGAGIVEFFAAPTPGEPAPKPLPGGRRRNPSRQRQSDRQTSDRPRGLGHRAPARRNVTTRANQVLISRVYSCQKISQLRRSSPDLIFPWDRNSVVTTDPSFVIFVIVSGYDAPRI
jgi:transcriptional regulator with XRE-family HTH domain